MADRKWYEIIIWWETRRILYNFVMLIVGFLSLYIGYVSIPLVYLVTGIGLNVLYTFGWIFELLLIQRQKDFDIKAKYPKHSFVLLLVFSTITVLGMSIALMI